MWFRSWQCQAAFHLHFTCTSPLSLITLIIPLLAPFIFMYLFFFSQLVWQGVSTSGKNAGEPKIATCGCQLTAGCAASFDQISFINRWHRSSRDVCSSNHAYENSVRHCMYCNNVCVCVSGVCFMQLLICALNTESSCFIKTASWELSVCHC